MKRIFAIMFLLGATVFTVQAQNYREMDKIVMHEGKVVLMHGDMVRQMLETVTLEDGGKVTTDGIHIAKDGTQSKLKDGDIVYITGKRSTEKPVKASAK